MPALLPPLRQAVRKTFPVTIFHQPPQPPVRLQRLVPPSVLSFIHADSRTLRSLWWLVARPGTLEIAHFRNKNAGYLNPLQLYAYAGMLFCLLALCTNPITFEDFGYLIQPQLLEGLYATGNVHHYMFSVAFAEKANHLIPVLVGSLLLLPTLALRLLYNYKKFSFARHFTFSGYFLAFTWLVGIPGILHESLAVIGVFGMLLYLLLALRNVYREDFLRTALKAAFIWLAVIFALHAFLYLSVNYAAYALVHG